MSRRRAFPAWRGATTSERPRRATARRVEPRGGATKLPGKRPSLSPIPNINRARAQGHEVLIEIPLEPFDFPDNDTGPQTLMSSGSAEENQRRLEYLLAKASGYFGVVNYMGGKFASSTAASGGFMRNLKNRGLGFISDGSSASLGNTARTNGVKTITADRNIDQRPSAADIEAQLGALEAMATQRGNALGFGVAYSVTIDKINAWASAAAGRGVTLIPASALAS